MGILMVLAFIAVAILVGLSIAAKIHGVVLCFQKKWYMGVVALLVPFFPEIVSVAKVVFKKDLLQ